MDNLNSEPRETIKVLGRHVYRGPHLYGKTPMIHIKLDLGPLASSTTHSLPGFVAKLLSLLPSLQQHPGASGTPGGLVQQLQQGMPITQLLQVLAMELQCLAGSQVQLAPIRPPLPSSTASHVLYPYAEERLGLLAGWFALRMVHHLLPAEFQGIRGSSRLIPSDVSPRAEFDDPLDVEGDIRVLNRIFRRYGLGPTTRSLVDEARNRGIPWMRLDDQSLVQLGYGRHQHRIRGDLPHFKPRSRKCQRQGPHQAVAGEIQRACPQRKSGLFAGRGPGGRRGPRVPTGVQTTGRQPRQGHHPAPDGHRGGDQSL
ncbi:hypothetical protein DC3_25860 [Deinococcus cellulosilyticus NBRC 106333 = KACC 11606]|uniref:Cyanophycin synthase-like N-terminal domain-containing protein n=1 Tax=Deinococcus cellulosilyticus (strain DSM 18568 / NBRC 106333 / KACC 11606 / 5516J-15) TaxID=1223518 RepID=A0A511N3I9_DEIC1|nr:hypothetical protein DC3_25860 [Deinococcus cellulosilyticus NBRC 106333 = KACC 11606]